MMDDPKCYVDNHNKDDNDDNDDIYKEDVKYIFFFSFFFFYLCYYLPTLNSCVGSRRSDFLYRFTLPTNT